jgi:hypothetical protein
MKLIAFCTCVHVRELHVGVVGVARVLDELPQPVVDLVVLQAGPPFALPGQIIERTEVARHLAAILGQSGLAWPADECDGAGSYRAAPKQLTPAQG